MNQVEIKFYKALIFFKYYLSEATNRLKEMGKEEQKELNLRFKKETKNILKMDECPFKKYDQKFIMFLKDRYGFEVKNELFSKCHHFKKRRESV